MPARITIQPILASPKEWEEYGRKFERYIRNYLINNAGPMFKKDLEGTTAGWSHKPVFKIKFYKRSDSFVLDVFPTGKNALNWARVTLGTKRRSIRPKRPGGKLVFPKFYSPHTIPQATRNIVGGPGRRYGPNVVTKRVRKHRIRPRNFERNIVEVRVTEVRRSVSLLVDKAFK